MRRTLIILVGAVVAACADPASPDPGAVDIEVTNLSRQPSGQWLVEFSITNVGPSTVFLPRCDEVLTGIERWTGSDWQRLHFEACLAARDRSLGLTPQAVVHGDRVLMPAGRFRLHVRYAGKAGVDFDRVAVTDPIDVPESDGPGGGALPRTEPPPRIREREGRNQSAKRAMPTHSSSRT